ncbi:MAG TPA: ATP-binding protein [Candidatus Tectomicrobia bacterium]|nr:ATP-binding protein [Candidatus Tectomicrobia bacterium]
MSLASDAAARPRLISGVLAVVRRRISLKLTLTLVGFVGVTTLVAGLYLTRALERFAVESLEERLTTAARVLHDEARALVTRGAPASEVRAFAVRAARLTGSRVTVVAPDGRVLGDSDVPEADLDRLENHRDRPEIQAALEGRTGRDIRTSVSIHAPIMYVAVPLEDGARIVGVLRMALPAAAVTSAHRDLHRLMLAGGVVALVVALGIGLFVAGRVTRPVVEMEASARKLAEGDFQVRVPVRSTDELGALGHAFNVLAARLREKIDDLETERAKATAILDGMVEGVVAVDGHERIVLMNERARAMFGMGPARVEGKPFLEVVRNADLHEVFRAVRTAPGGRPVRRELRLRYPSARTLEVSAVPLRLGGEEPGAVMVVHDVTELRRLEHVRTEFIANVSHELRTPLTAIQGYLETLLGGALDEAEHARSFVEIAFRHTERLGRLVNDLTDLSNIELGKVSLQRSACVLAEVAESVVEIVRGKAETAGVTLRLEVPAVLAVDADHDRLQQILINLVDNAVKYTPRGGTITVGARQADPKTVEIVVADTGIGIPHADLPRITERFYRVDKARSRELGGTGLGLAIVKHLVLAHGGELALESEEGRGTTVRVTLPTAAA